MLSDPTRRWHHCRSGVGSFGASCVSASHLHPGHHTANHRTGRYNHELVYLYAFFFVVVLFRQFQFQATLETVATVVPALDSSPPPLVVDSPTELLSAAATPDVAQSAAELVVDAAPTALEVLQAAAAEPSLAELGLANHTPVGLIQNMLEFMHVDLGLPWWGAIVVGKCNLK